MIVRIVKDWSFPDIMRQTPGSYGKWNDILFTEEDIDADVLIVLNSPHKPIITNSRKGGKWLFSQESPVEMYRWHTRSFPYFDKVFTFWPKSSEYCSNNIIHSQTALPWHINKNYDELVSLSVGEQFKNDKISWITSNATHKPGHKLRMDFKTYLETNNVQFDLFGRGFTPIEDKFDGIFPYKYSLAIENYACNDYWTEKIADCFLSWTMPIYYGCTNITKYFPAESMILIDPSNPYEAIKKIESAIVGNLWERNLSAIKMARERILNDYQFFPTVSNLVKTSGLGEDKKWSFIPSNKPGDKMTIKKQLDIQGNKAMVFLKNIINA